MIKAVIFWRGVAILSELIRNDNGDLMWSALGLGFSSPRTPKSLKNAEAFKYLKDSWYATEDIDSLPKFYPKYLHDSYSIPYDMCPLE